MSSGHGEAATRPLERSLEVASRLLHPLRGAWLEPPKAVAAGANSRVFRVETGQGPVALKLYGSAGQLHGAQRLQAEWAALCLLHSHGFTDVPQPLACDQDAGVALLGWVDGHVLPPAAVGEPQLELLLDLVARIQSLRGTSAAQALGDAAEARFSLASHVALVRARFERLEGALAEMQHPAATRALGWLVERLEPAFDAWLPAMRARAQAYGEAWEAPLDAQLRVLSPSDLGYHNALVDAHGRVTWIDLEYFGWCDPGKLLADLVLQPDRPVPAELRTWCARRLAAHGPWGDAGVRRASILLPLFAVKWCLIMLNPFMRAESYAAYGEAGAPILGERLLKVEAYLRRAALQEGGFALTYPP